MKGVAEIARKIPWVRIGAEAGAIVVSILLAFSIDAWNEQRSERALEAEYLQRIGDELRDARVVLESIIRDADGNLLYAPELSEFLQGHVAAPDHQRLVVAIHKFGLDPLDAAFDVSTFNDLVSTGRLRLITNPEVRLSIQRAYARLQRLEPVRAPYRDAYKFALSGWIPRPINQQIRAACREQYTNETCSGLELDDDDVRSVLERIDTREALLAFQIRERGLLTLRGIGTSTLAILDETLKLLEP